MAAMPRTVSQQQLIERFGQLGIGVEKHDHSPVATVEAMAQEMQSLGVAGVCTKNLFLKDKKNRLYIITAAKATKVDLRVLSARLGMGKSGMRFAPEELLGPVLGLTPGSVTPLALVQPGAGAVVLLLDKRLQGQPRLLVHPLTNESTVAMSGEALNRLLESLGRVPHYVDLEADPKIGRDNPPDLAQYVAGTDAVTDEELAAAHKLDAAVLASGGAAAAAASADKKVAAAAAKKGGAARTQGVSDSAMDVEVLAASLLKRITGAVGSDGGAPADPEAARRLHADVLSQLNTLRNASYAAGMRAGKGQIMAAIDGSHA